MNKNLSDFIPTVWAEPWNQGTDWTGDGSRNGVTQELLDKDMDRLKIDKSQFQINMEDFHTHYGRYYTRTDIEHFKKRGTPYETFNRELTDKELGYKLYINKENYEESYEYTILKLNPTSVDIKKLGLDETPPAGYYALPKGYLRGLYVNHILDKANPKSVSQIVEYLKKIDDDLFYAPTRAIVSKTAPIEVKQESSVVLYPNPVDQFLHIDSDMDEAINTVEIYSIAGFKTLSFFGLESKNTLNVDKLPQGIHVVVVETDRGRFTFRIMKK